MTASNSPLTLDFLRLFDMAPIAFLVLDPQLQIVAVSDAYRATMLMEGDELIGRNVTDVFAEPPDGPGFMGIDDLCTSIEQVLRDHAAVSGPILRREVFEDGGFEERFWRPQTVPIFGDGGQLTNIIHMLEDLTDVMRLSMHEDLPQTPGQRSATPAPVSDRSAADARAQPQPESPRRVLLVEDNVDIAEVTAHLLTLMGHDVRAVNDGQTALDLAPHFRPDVVLLDIGLPKMDGFAVARQMRRLEATASATIIAVTGYGQPEHFERSEGAAFDLYLVKPVDTERLSRIIARAPLNQGLGEFGARS